MSDSGSITQWLQQIQEGRAEAAEALWQRYYQRLIRLAHSKLRDLPRRMIDEDDVVAEAFQRFLSGAEQGKFPRLADRDDLWRVLVTLTARQAVNEFKRQTRAKRGGGKVRGESVFGQRDDSQPRGIDEIIGSEPTDAFASSVAGNVQRLLAGLEESSLRAVAQLKMEGLTNRQIAGRLACSERTIERKLNRIRRLWESELPPGE